MVTINTQLNSLFGPKSKFGKQCQYLWKLPLTADRRVCDCIKDKLCRSRGITITSAFVSTTNIRFVSSPWWLIGGWWVTRCRSPQPRIGKRFPVSFLGICTPDHHFAKPRGGYDTCVNNPLITRRIDWERVHRACLDACWADLIFATYPRLVAVTTPPFSSRQLSIGPV